LLSAVHSVAAWGRAIAPVPVIKKSLMPTAHPIAVVEKSANPDSSGPPSGALTPAEIRNAYGFDQVSFGSITGDGTGQTIALIDGYDDPNALGDLEAFDAQFGLPDPPSFQRVAQDGSTNYPPTDPAGPGTSSWELEESLDIEWAHAIAPGANILLVEANGSSTTSSVNLTDLITAATWAANQPGVVAVSMSFGSGESPSDLSEDSSFTTPAGHAGVTFLAATGDEGPPGGYPADSPNVVAVGGTTLTLDANGNYLSESAWSGSGGGVSTFEAQPTYQYGMVASYSTTKRTIPDVSMDADPNSGVAVYDSYDFPTSPWIQIGGTSLATPIWAGLIAIADQGRAILSLPSLDGATQTLPMLYQLPASDFHDITTGTTTNGGHPAKTNSAAVGYDLTTGRGTPIANDVIYGLVGTGSISGTVFQDNNSDGIQDGTDTALSGVTVYLDSNNDGTYEAGTTTTVSNNTVKGIPDNSSKGATSSVTVSGTVGAVSNLSVTINISHPKDSDLTALLISPSGSEILLFTGLPGTNFTNTVLSDQAANSISSSTGAHTGTFYPTDALADFDGKSANGTWSLKVIDGVSLNTGSIQSWSLSVTTGTADVYKTTTNASGQYSFSNLPLGVSYTVEEVPPAGYVQSIPTGNSGYATVPLFTMAAHLNFSNFPTVFNATGTNDSYYLAMDPSDTYLQISQGTTGLSPASYQVALASLPSLTINLLGANSVLVVDFSNGAPIPGGNITLNTNSSSNQELRILGQNPAQAFTLSNAQLTLNSSGGTIFFQSLPTLTLADSTTTVSGDLNSIQNLNIDSGASFIF